MVAPGLKSDFKKIPGLEEALKDPNSGVSSIYKEESVEKAWKDIQEFGGGRAVSPLMGGGRQGLISRGEQIFTQPAGIIKCAGAPQKVSFGAETRPR